MGLDLDAPGVAFGRWQMLPERRQLLRDGTPVPLSSRAFDVLLALVEARGETLSKDALMKRVWPGAIVEDNSLQVQISTLRKAFGLDAAGLIATIPGRGYRFIGALAPNRATARERQPKRPVVVVLPFRNLSGDPEQEYFADGISEDLTTALSHLRWFSVIARNSAFTYKGRVVDAREISRELGVGYALEGSVRKVGTRVRIAVQFSETAAGRQIWGRHFDGDLADIFALQDQVCEAVAAAVEPNLRRAEIERSRSNPTENVDAYDLYLRALPHRLPTREGSDKAIQLLRRAMELDAGFAAAKGALAGQMVLRVTQGWAGPEEAAEALHAARELAAEEHVDDPTALAWAGHALTFLGREYETGLAASDRALRHAPNSGTALFLGGWNRLYVGDWRTAVAQIERAMRLSPIDPCMFYFTATLGAAYFVGEDYDATVTWERRTLHDHPTYLVAHRLLAASLAWLGATDEARQAVADLLVVAPGYTVEAAAAHSAFRGTTRERYLAGLRRAGLPPGGG